MAPRALHQHRFRERLPIVCMLLLLSCSGSCSRAQLDIIAITPAPYSSGSPNTLLGTVGIQIASALLPAGTAAILWGAVPSSAVVAACELMVNTGQHSFTANISHDSWGGSEYLTLQVRATGGCLAASDASGTQFSFIDNYDRYSAIVCPSNAGLIGCGVYMTGDDVTTIYESWYSDSSIHSTMAESRIMLGDLQDNPITGTVTGVMTAANCTELGDLAPFCSPGDIGFAARSGCPACIANCDCPTCFPGDALVQTRDGTVIPMSQLQVGDQIAVLGHNGVVTYDDVYAFGHKDVEALSMFTKIIAEPIDDAFEQAEQYQVYSTNTTTTLRLSAHHFVPTSTSLDGLNKARVYKRANDVQLGDAIWATYENADGVKHVFLSRVTDISATWGHGLYNPLTLSGTIIVDNVVASVHSEWFLDRAFDTVGLTHLLPAAYQFVLTPVRGLYQMMGKKAYSFLYDKVDAYFDIPQFGTKYGGRVTLGACAVVMSAPLIMRLALPTKNP